MTFNELTRRIKFTDDVPAEVALKVLAAYITLPDNEDDGRSSYVVRPVEDGFECDNCGDVCENYTIDQHHPEGGSHLGMECCWTQEDR